MVTHRNLTISFNGHLSQALPLTIPPRLLTELINSDMLFMIVAREDVVYTKCLVTEPFVKILRIDGDRHHHANNSQQKSFHILPYFK